MATQVTLQGNAVWGGGRMRFQAVIGPPPLTFSGALVQPVDFSQMIADLLGGSFLELPPDFPRVVFQSASAHFVAGQSFAFEATSTIAWERPFGKLTGLSFDGLTLAFETASQQATTLGFSATVRYNGLDVSGALLFSGGRLAVAGISLATPLDVAAFLSQSVPGLNWGDLLPIRFGPSGPESPMRLYYAKGAFDDYRDGFNLDHARIEVMEYGANVDLQVADGVSIAGSLNQAIDFGFLRLSGPDGTGSPQVAVRCTKQARSFGLRTRMTFLQETAAVVEVGVARAPQSSDYQFAGRVEIEEEIPRFGRPKFGFTWSRKRGFRVEAWEISDFPGSELLDFVELLNKIPSGGCAPFVKQMFRAAVKTRFNFKASMDSPGAGTDAAAGLAFTVRGTYTISAAGVQDVLTVPLPADLHVRLEKPEQFSFEALGKALGDAILAAAEDMVRQVVEDPGRSAAFFGIVIAQAALPQVISMLVCRLWRPPVPPPPPPPPPPIPPVIPVFPPFLPPPPYGPPGPTSVATLRCQHDTIAVSWSTSSQAQRYRTVLRNSTESLRLEAEWTGLSATLAVPDSWPSDSYGFNVQGVGPGGVGPWSPLVTVLRLASVTITGFAQEGLELRLTWARQGGAPEYERPGSYEYVVYGPSGVVYASDSVLPSVFSARIPILESAGEGVYTAIVRAAQPDQSALASQWSGEAQVTMERPTAPGFRTRLQNDTPPGPDALVTALLTDPAIPGEIPVAAGQSAPLFPGPIVAFLAWRSAAATARCRTVAGAWVQASGSGGDVTLAYSSIIAGTLPPAFTRTLRRGVLAGQQDLLWADLLTTSETAGALQPYVNSSADLASLLVYLYPTLDQAALCTALATGGWRGADLTSGLLAVRQHYADVGSPVTPSSAAVAVFDAWASVGPPPAPADLARALLPPFAAIGQPLSASTLAVGLLAAIPIGPITVATLEPYVQALKGGDFGIAAAAAALVAALPGVSAVPLAGALKWTYLGPTPTVGEYAESLHGQGLIAQAATPLLIAGYVFPTAQDLAQLLVDYFPETAGTPLLLCWCLSVAGTRRRGAADAVVLVLPGVTAVELAAALKTTYPSPAVDAAVAALQREGRTAQQAGAALLAGFPDLTPTQAAWLMFTRFAATAPDALALALALAGDAVPMTGTAVALHRLFPRLTAAEIAAILKAAYQGTES